MFCNTMYFFPTKYSNITLHIQNHSLFSNFIYCKLDMIMFCTDTINADLNDFTSFT